MDIQQIETIVINVVTEYCQAHEIDTQIDKNTPLIGSQSIVDSLGLVNIIVDVEMAFLDEEIEISLASEAAMSSRISPFRSIGSLCNFIAKQLGAAGNE